MYQPEWNFLFLKRREKLFFKLLAFGEEPGVFQRYGELVGDEGEKLHIISFEASGLPRIIDAENSEHLAFQTDGDCERRLQLQRQDEVPGDNGRCRTVVFEDGRVGTETFSPQALINSLRKGGE
jgi:hypothetical protein